MTEEQLNTLDRLLGTEMPLVAIATEIGMSYHTLRIRLAERSEEIRRARVPVKREAAANRSQQLTEAGARR